MSEGARASIVRPVNGLAQHATALRVRWRAARGRLGGRWRRVYHYHVRKTAGTSLNAAFWSLAGLELATLGQRQKATGRGLTIIRHDLARIARGEWFYANAHTPAHGVSVPAETFTMTILRDPVARIRSLYRYLLWARDEPDASRLDPYYTSLTEEGAWLGSSFQEFLGRVPREHLERQLFMFSAHFDVEEAVAAIADVDAVCFTETFAADLEAAARRLGLTLVQRRERSFGANVTLSADDEAAARERLAAEIRLIERVRAAHEGDQR